MRKIAQIFVTFLEKLNFTYLLIYLLTYLVSLRFLVNYGVVPVVELSGVTQALTEGVTYPQLSTQPKFFVHISNSYSSLIWSP